MTTDEKILMLIKQGKDNEALSLIYKSTLPKIKRYILQNNGTEEEFKDIFQDSVIRFYKKVKTGEFKEGGSIEAYIITIAKNLYTTYVTRHVNRHVKLDPLNHMVENDNVLQNIISNERVTIIEKAFSEIGTICIELLKLSLYSDLNMKQIAVEMGFSNENVAKTKNYKCKQRLAKVIKENKGLYNFLSN